MSANVIYTTNHRRVWIDTYGSIPKDDQGRSFEIHHINGNHDDNRLENLKCVSIQEHYNIHLKQGDWAACLKIANRLNMCAEEISELASRNASRNNKKRVESGTHHWLKNNMKKKECSWCHGAYAPSLYSRCHGDYCRSNPNAMPRKPHKKPKKKECPWCHKMAQPSNYARYHGDKCLSNPNAMPRKAQKPQKPFTNRQCQWCHRQFNPGVYAQFHGDKCLSNPNAMPRKPFQKRQCQWCHRQFNPANYGRYHGDKCKLKPKSCSFI